ncbi:MAG: efflux RND transporter periplasmic adaptor subunit [Tepidisphaera sp.]|nr:efflux RND transporter periplasmic adaptor subunit [Tepidisphaera sp.]
MNTDHSTTSDSMPDQASAAEATMPALSRAARIGVPLSLALTLCITAACVIVFGVLPAAAARAALERDTQTRLSQLPRVVVKQVEAASKSIEFTLPARIEALQETAVYAREGGYLRERHADIGDHVDSGQVLALIDTPVLDKQIASAQADIGLARARLAQADSDLELAKISLKRLESVDSPGAVTAQALDDARAKVASQEAARNAAASSLDASQVNLQQLQARKAFATIEAPFAGEITQRNYDVGALIIADKTDTNRPLFSISDRDTLNVYVEVPQSLALAIQPGQHATLDVPELAGRRITGQVARAAAAINSTTRTRLVQVQVENKDHLLLPGMFARCTFEVPRLDGLVVLPAEAMLIRDGKPAAGVVRSDSTIHYVALEIDRDLGPTLEIKGGLSVGDRVALNVTRQPPEGAKVQIVDRDAPEPLK